MGNSIDKFGGYGDSDSSQDIPSTSKCGKKRKHSNDGNESPVKVTKLDTAKYVYDRLFLHGENSDVKVHALGETWNLHVLYLQQCDYFRALFDGEWKDSQTRDIFISVPDESVTVEGLRAVFGSLYDNEIQYEVEKIEGVLAAASLFQLQSVLDRCSEDLIQEINISSVVKFVNISKKYGLQKLLEASYAYLKLYFWIIVRNRTHLRCIDEKTFESLITNPQLLVIEGEIDLYRTIKNWIALRIDSKLEEVAEKEFDKEVTNLLSSFPSGELFMENAPLIASLRLHHLVTSTGSIQEIEKDNLIPKNVLQAVMIDQFKSILHNEENPLTAATISDEDFYLNCIRLGRVVEDSPKCWRWTGFNYGVDIILNYNRGLLTMKRNCLHQATPYSVNLKSERIVHFRIIVIDNKGDILNDSGKQMMSLRVDQSVVVCRVAETTLPLAIHFFYLASQSAPPTLLYVNRYAKSIHPRTL